MRTAADPAPAAGEAIDSKGSGAPGVDQSGPAGEAQGQTKMWPKPEYWDRENYQGYWEDLGLPKSGWRRPTRIVSGVALIFVFFIPELIDGMWWATLVISEAVVATIVILGTPGGKLIAGRAYFRRRLVAPIVISLALLGFLGLEVYNSLLFGTWSLSGTPPVILACGARYAQDGPAIGVPSGLVLHPVGKTPSGVTMLVNDSCGGPSPWAFVSIGHGEIIPFLQVGWLGPIGPYTS